MTLAELLAMLTALATLDAEGLAQLQADLTAAAQERLEADPTDEVLAELDSIGEALATIRTEVEARETDLAERIARRDAAAARIAEATAGPDDPEPPAPDPDEPVVPDPEAAAVPADPAADPAVPAPEPVAASVVPPVAPAPAAAPVVTRVAARRPASTQPRRPAVTAAAVIPDNIEDWGLHASAGSQDLVPGSRIRTLEELGVLFASAIDAGEGVPINGLSKTRVAFGGSRNVAEVYPNDRILGSDPYDNERKLAMVTSPQAIAAAGGICAPPVVRYDLPILAGSEARPVRDQLATRFGADRGAVTTMTPPVIEGAAAGIGTWTNAQDIAGVDTKTCMEIVCPDNATSTIQAITSCITLGNFRARYFGELIQAFITLLAVNQARKAETIAIQKIGAGSTQVNTGQVLGTARDVLSSLDRAVAALRNRHRFQSGQMPLRFGAPDWLHDMIRVDIARQMPVGTVDETLALADGKIEQWFRVRNVNVSWLLEGESGQNFAQQLDGPLVGWPTNVVTYLFPEGTWLFLDGGSLDLGIVRDSILNAQNKFQIFSETMETVHKHGVESWRVSMDVCPDGSASALIDIDPCGVGS